MHSLEIEVGRKFSFVDEGEVFDEDSESVAPSSDSSFKDVATLVYEVNPSSVPKGEKPQLRWCDLRIYLLLPQRVESVPEI